MPDARDKFPMLFVSTNKIHNIEHATRNRTDCKACGTLNKNYQEKQVQNEYISKTIEWFLTQRNN